MSRCSTVDSHGTGTDNEAGYMCVYYEMGYSQNGRVSHSNELAESCTFAYCSNQGLPLLIKSWQPFRGPGGPLFGKEIDLQPADDS